MKVLLITLMASSLSTNLMAKEIKYFEEETISPNTDLIVDGNFSQEMKVTYLTKLLDHQQKYFDDKVSFLEKELLKTRNQLIEKSMNQEKIEEAMIDRFGAESKILKKELAYKTKSLLEHQRLLEKVKPSEELKNMVKLNTELASELRKSEDQVAFIQLKQIEAMPGIKSGSRLPASVPEEK